MDIEEVRKHNTKDDCWVIVHNKAYDLTDFMDSHPGGAAIILKYAGKDCTKIFDPIHPGDTFEKYLDKKYHKGEVKPAKRTASSARKRTPPSSASGSASTATSTSASSPASTSTTGTGASATATVVDEFDVEYDEQENKKAIEYETPDEEYDDEDDPPDEYELERRKYVKNKPELGALYNLHDFEYVASKTVEKVAWAYYSSGSDDEITLRENHLGYSRIFFQPRILVNVEKVDFTTTMLGSKVAAPFYVTATALGKLGHPDGEKVLTRAAHDQNVVQMISMLSSCSLDEIIDEARDDQPQWLQVYVNSDRKVTEDILRHAEKRGIKGLFVTVDAPQLGRREKDMRSKNVKDVAYVQNNDSEVDRMQGAARAISSFIDMSLSWKDIEWLRSLTKLPLMLKGVQTVADTLKAIEYGLDGVVLSNHGGRQLDFSKPPIEVLAELHPILKERGLKDKFEVYIDGGVRRATDILKAICLGAKGVGIGRPFLYAMCTYGDEGVYKAMQILKDELTMNMRLLGVTSLDQLDESFVDVSNMGGRIVAEDRLYKGNYQPLTTPVFGKL